MLPLASKDRRALVKPLPQSDVPRVVVAQSPQRDGRQPTLARLETTAADTKLSTVERFAGALGYAIEYHLVPASKSMRRQGIVVES